MTRVYIIESERGWGQKVEEAKEFPTREEAEQFCREYKTPDWYVFARLEGQNFGMLRLEDK